VDDLLWNGVYRRDFANGAVLVNPAMTPVRVSLGATMKRVELEGGGAISAAGDVPGRVATSSVTTLEIAAKDAAILLRYR
jgi:hypothetical protein